MPSLILSATHSGRTQAYPLEGLAFAGGAPDNDIVLAGAGMPDVALKLDPDPPDGLRFEVLDRAADARLNGHPVRAARLVPGDTLEIAGYRLGLAFAAAEPRPAAKAPMLEGLARLSETAASEEDLRGLLGKMARVLPDLVGGSEAVIFTLDAEGRLGVSACSARGQEGTGAEAVFSDTAVQRALKTGHPVFVPDALSDPEFSASRSVHDLRLISVLCCPIRVAGRVAGAIYLGARHPSPGFEPSDLEALEVHALLAGVLVQQVERITKRDAIIAGLRGASAEEGVIAQSPAMRALLAGLASVASGDIAVMLQGETGTGKDVAAEYLHRKSRRADKPLVAVNCATLRGDLLASELFGHKRGAFTGAYHDRKGLFAQAQGGTLFLDEIGDMDLALQTSLLRALERRRIRPVGAAEEEEVDVRVLCATHRDLAEMVRAGAFRADLYYRINQAAFRIPPLRERAEDIPLLAYHFLRRYQAQYPERGIEDFDPSALRAMAMYAWPGNVRELVNAVHKAVLVSPPPLARLDFLSMDSAALGMEEATERFRREYADKALAQCGGNKEKAAALLGVSRATIFRLLGGKGGKDGEM